MAQQSEHNAKDINADEFDSAVLKSEKAVLVDFWAPWCGPCLMMAPVLEEIADEYSEHLDVVKVNTEEGDNGSLAAQYQVRSIPNMKLFKGGEIIHEFIGFRPKDSFIEELKEALGI